MVVSNAIAAKAVKVKMVTPPHATAHHLFTAVVLNVVITIANVVITNSLSLLHQGKTGYFIKENLAE